MHSLLVACLPHLLLIIIPFMKCKRRGLTLVQWHIAILNEEHENRRIHDHPVVRSNVYSNFESNRLSV